MTGIVEFPSTHPLLEAPRAKDHPARTIPLDSHCQQFTEGDTHLLDRNESVVHMMSKMELRESLPAHSLHTERKGVNPVARTRDGQIENIECTVYILITRKWKRSSQSRSSFVVPGRGGGAPRHGNRVPLSVLAGILRRKPRRRSPIQPHAITFSEMTGTAGLGTSLREEYRVPVGRRRPSGTAASRPKDQICRHWARR